jgi:hypothetical protein
MYAEEMKEERLPGRDWIVLPLIGLVTVGILGVCTELFARWAFPSGGDLKSCVYTNAKSIGLRGIPNTVCRAKIPEGQWTNYRFNSNGDYTELEGLSKPSGVYRIVMIGTSYPMGDGVAQVQSFAVLLPRELTHLTGRKVELYNESLPRKSARVFSLRFNEVLAPKPDLILWVLNYSDVRIASIIEAGEADRQAAFIADVSENSSSQISAIASEGSAAPGPLAAWKRLSAKAKYAASSLAHAVNDRWRDTSSFVLLTNVMDEIENQSQFVKRNRTSEAQYLNAVPSEERLRHLKDFDRYAGEMEDRAKAAGVPFCAVFLPTRIQAAMISSGDWPASIDPFKLNEEMRAIIVSHGGTYIDILHYFRTIPNPERGFFPADGHLNPRGHAMISGLLARELTNGAASALKAKPL